MTMNQRLGVLSPELKIPTSGLLFFNDEFFEEKRRFGHVRCVGIPDEVRILVPERQDTAWLAADDGIAAVNERVELADVEVCILPGRLSEAFRNHRPAAASSLFRQADFIASRFEKLRGRFADIGVVEIDEGVVEENHFPR